MTRLDILLNKREIVRNMEFKVSTELALQIANGSSNKSSLQMCNRSRADVLQYLLFATLDMAFPSSYRLL